MPRRDDIALRIFRRGRIIPFAVKIQPPLAQGNNGLGSNLHDCPFVGKFCSFEFIFHNGESSNSLSPDGGEGERTGASVRLLESFLGLVLILFEIFGRIPLGA